MDILLEDCHLMVLLDSDVSGDGIGRDGDFRWERMEYRSETKRAEIQNENLVVTNKDSEKGRDSKRRKG